VRSSPEEQRAGKRVKLTRGAQALMRGANAAVVGILAAEFYNPVWSSTVAEPLDFAIAIGGFLLLTIWKVPPWAVVALLALSGLGLSALHMS
jgi:chromate transporter